MKNLIFAIIFGSLLPVGSKLTAQVNPDSTSVQDTLPKIKKLTVSGYVDAYYSYHFQNPTPHSAEYFYSSAKRNEFSVNLAYVDLNYTSPSLKARFIPAVGTYMESNYAAERPIFRNVFQATGSVRLFRDFWLEAGVLPSPFGYETAISKDQLTYSRSFSAENSPYYLAGARLGIPVSEKISLSVYAINGWQNINETNKSKSFATQVQYKVNDHLLLNWSSYLGNEQTVDSLKASYRFFNDCYLFFNKGKWSVVALFDIGRQNVNDTVRVWHTANFKARYNITPKIALAGRAEYYSDPHSVIITPLSPTKGFEVYGFSANVDYTPASDVLLRLEGRSLTAKNPVFMKENQTFSKSALTLIASLTVSF
jgi:hypothetical protein